MNIHSLAPSLSWYLQRRSPRICVVVQCYQSRGLTAQVTVQTPLRKHLKDEAKRKKAEQRNVTRDDAGQKHETIRRLEKWELTVGIEVHAELNTASKLFSDGPATGLATPNTHVTVFDAALPGTQPQFQIATLIPAIRAATVLNCDIQQKSGWDRKHYFHWDQPNGYQITQYYAPFAKNGKLILSLDDGVPASDLNGAQNLEIGIKQIQMEQDTAKISRQSSVTHHVDLNRAGHPLVEIITLPQIHSPQTAAAVVRKIQALLKSIDACVTGIELGGLRADVNVSVRERGTHGIGASYGGVSSLGQRTEIKNLASFKAIEDAVVAERDRQIEILESGGVIEGETRGFTLGANKTTKLRGKEGEVDYRYMPEPDLPPVLVDPMLLDHLRHGLPELPDHTVARVQATYGLSLKDAKTLAALDNGDRLEYMEHTVELLAGSLDLPRTVLGKVVSNWVLHEIGGLLTPTEMNTGWSDMVLLPEQLADILQNLLRKQITTTTAKQLVTTLLTRNYDLGASFELEAYIDRHHLRLRPLSRHGYIELATQIMVDSPEMVEAVRKKGQKGKIMWFVGQMVRRGEEGMIEPEKAKQVVEDLLNRQP